MDELVETVRSAVKPRVAQYEGNAALARSISLATEGAAPAEAPRRRPTTVIGMTGSPGAGKSTLVAQIAAESVQRGEKLAVVAYDPMSPITGGGSLVIGFGLILVGWMNRCSTDRSRLPVRITKRLPEILELIGGAGFDRVIVETVGAGQKRNQNS